MKIRNKVLLLIVAVWFIMMIPIYVGTHVFLRDSFQTLENDQVDRNLTRVEQSLQQIMSALSSFTSDWAAWDDAYKYLQGTNPAFVPNNITVAAYVTSHINLLLYIDSKGKTWLGNAANLDVPELVPLPSGMSKYFYLGGKIYPRKNVNDDFTGFILLPSGIMMVASSAVTSSDKTAPMDGTLVTGRYIGPQVLKLVSDATKLDLVLYYIPEFIKDPHQADILSSLTNGNGHYIQIKDKKIIYGYDLLRDVNGDPIGVIRISDPRTITASGINATNYYMISFLIFVGFTTLVMWIILRKFIIRRLEQLNKDIIEIESEESLSKRVNEEGSDELSFVSKEVNKMLSIIQKSKNELEDRVDQRTKELKQEIVERKSIEQELVLSKEHLNYLAHYDSLTALPNRVLFNDMLNKAIAQAKRHNNKLAILFIDLDRFKNINDALGHHVGDGVLKEIANRFAMAIRTEDTIARLGGDEFIVLLNNVDDPKHSVPVTEKILSTLEKPIIVNQREFYLNASIGICIYPQDGNSLEDLLKNADMAMYRAKRAGGGSFHFYTSEMNLNAHKYFELEADLRKAIINQEFVVYYQPKLDLKTGKIHSVEALVRWVSPEHGLIPPIDFIQLAEETGLILRIGQWVLQQSCIDNKKWHELGYDVPVAVNISPVQFRAHNLVQIVKDALESTQLDPSHLEVEITESTVMEDVDLAIQKLKNIRDMGISITVDDFGTGYSSIGYLKQFPLNTIKIDKSFIDGIPQNKDNMTITEAIIALVHSLGYQIVAEGVETKEQIDTLARVNCDIIQGYYFSRPIPYEKVLEFFEEHKKSSIKK